jgi:hypothetical protein
MGTAATSRATLFVMVVGPGEGALAVDTLDSIRACEPAADICVLDDCTADGTHEILTDWAAAHPGTLVRRNPTRRGYRGIATSVFSLLEAIAGQPRVPELIIKIDPDTYLIAPGVADLMRRRFAAVGPGIVGPYRIGANGGARTFGRLRRNMLLDLLPVGVHKDRRSVRVGLPFWASYLALARRHGYEMGEHVLGALSGMHGDTLRAIHDSGFLGAIPERYRALTVEEDVLLGLATRAVGHHLIDITQDPSTARVWIQFRPPIPQTASALLESQMLAVHPLKASPEGEAIRSALRARRNGAAASPANQPA